MSTSETAASLTAAFTRSIPEGMLGLAACILFLGATFRVSREMCGAIAMVALSFAAIAVCCDPTPARAAIATICPVLADPLSLYVKIMAIVGGAVLVMFSWDKVPDNRAGEFFACMLVIVAGLCLTGSANDLVTLFLALEFISIPTYVLLYLQRNDRLAQEAAVKYFLLSIFSSAFLLFGFSYLYGMTGTTNLTAIIEALNRLKDDPQQLPALTLVALVMVLAGLGFKITAVPFHFYAPDVYQGTTPAAAALLAFIPKAAGVVALVRVLGYIGGPEIRPGFALGQMVPFLLWMLAIITMCVGNLMALLQDNLRRMLAYSSVAHAGYMLMGLAVAPYLFPIGSSQVTGTEAVLFYLVAYGAMTVGAFAVLAYLNTQERPVEVVDDLAGLSRSHPGLALVMAVFLFSLLGMPLTAGFMGKLLLFLGLLSVPPQHEGFAQLYRWLALVGALNTAIAAWYYLRIIGVMYLRTAIKPLTPIHSWPGLAAIWTCAALTLWLGVYPSPIVQAARRAVFMSPAETSTPMAARP